MAAFQGAGAKTRTRTCAASAAVLPERELVRFAAGPDGVIVADVAARLPGRGVWVRASRSAIETACKKGAFARALKTQVTAPADLAEKTEALLAQRALSFLGLMRRAGALALGAFQVESAIRAHALAAQIEASDGAGEGRNKLINLHIGLWGAPAPLCGCFTSAELGMALGRASVVHGCVLQERMAQSWAAELGRLAGFRAIVPSSWPQSGAAPERA